MSAIKENLHMPPNKLGTRHLQIVLMFLGMAIVYMVRVSMSVAVVAMRNKEDANENFPEYDWDNEISNMILSSFFWGYVVTQVPAGYIATIWSAQKLTACGIFISSILHMLTPVLADYGYEYVIVSRVVMGLCQGCLMPCMQTLLSRWVPPLERARLGSLVMNGPQLGTVVSMSLSGVLADSSIGWPSIFYVFSTVGIIWSVAFFFMAADHPSEHPRISPKEVIFINSSLGNLDKAAHTEKPPVPWKSILTSMPMWSLIIVHCGHNWGFYMLLTQLPNYMKSVLHYDISKSGTVLALPYLTMWLMCIPLSYAGDFAIRKGVSIAVVRKICNSIGLWIPATAILVLCLITTNSTTVVVTILVVAVGFNSGIICGFQINHIDLSPNFAGSMMAITNSLSSILGIVAPIVSGKIIVHESDVGEWNIVFYITVVIYAVTNLVFLVFGKADIQPWNDVRGELKVSPRRVSTISIAGEPTSVFIPEIIQEEEYKTPC